MPSNAAEIQGGKAVLRTIERNYAPGEASKALADCGVNICVARIRALCRSGKLKTLPEFRQYFIPESELLKLLRKGDAV